MKVHIERLRVHKNDKQLKNINEVVMADYENTVIILKNIIYPPKSTKHGAVRIHFYLRHGHETKKSCWCVVVGKTQEGVVFGAVLVTASLVGFFK